MTASRARLEGADLPRLLELVSAFGGVDALAAAAERGATRSDGAGRGRAAARARRHPAFLLLGEPLALDLVNTLVPPALGGDLLATPERVVEWLRAEADRLRPDTLEPPDVTSLAALREALRALFHAALDGRAPFRVPLRTVSAASRAGARYLDLEWTAAGGPRTRARPERRGGTAPGAELLAEIARSGIELLGGPGRKKLRRCDGPGCTLLFVATNPQRRWCAPHLCGNRVRVARHKRRIRSEGLGAAERPRGHAGGGSSRPWLRRRSSRLRSRDLRPRRHGAWRRRRCRRRRRGADRSRRPPGSGRSRLGRRARRRARRGLGRTPR
jgi:predicted RNA-binding Zn ribbon-like protein